MCTYVNMRFSKTVENEVAILKLNDVLMTVTVIKFKTT